MSNENEHKIRYSLGNDQENPFSELTGITPQTVFDFLLLGKKTQVISEQVSMEKFSEVRMEYLKLFREMMGCAVEIADPNTNQDRKTELLGSLSATKDDTGRRDMFHTLCWVAVTIYENGQPTKILPNAQVGIVEYGAIHTGVIELLNPYIERKRFDVIKGYASKVNVQLPLGGE